MMRYTGYELSHKALEIIRKTRQSGTPDWVTESAYDLFGERMGIDEFVLRIINEVRAGGDRSVINLTEKIEGERIESVVVPEDEMKNAYKETPSKLRDSLERMAERIESFHSRSMPITWNDDVAGYGQKFIPVESVGVYVPGGTAKYPSTVLMTAIPARVAGVSDVSLACPVYEDGLPAKSVLAAGYIAGVSTVYRIGGVQAIASLAYGTESVRNVDLICGPGNLLVTLAKKAVFGDVGIDGLYGPTETVLLADDSANPVLCAADLIAQAEHDQRAIPILITSSESLADEVEEQINIRLPKAERKDIAKGSIDSNGIISIVETDAEAIALVNEFAPEHLCILSENAGRILPSVKNAGMIFIGEYSHEVLGDYGAGPSHVMPTGGTAKFNAGLGVHTFLKPVPVVSIPRETALSIIDDVSEIAREEGLTAHAEAAEVRREFE